MYFDGEEKETPGEGTEQGDGEGSQVQSMRQNSILAQPIVGHKVREGGGRGRHDEGKSV